MHPAESEKDRHAQQEADQREAEHVRRLRDALDHERERAARRAKQLDRRACFHVPTDTR